MSNQLYRVLIMDDSEKLQSTFLRIFHSEELQSRYRLCDVVGTMGQAIDRLSHKPHVALLDLRGKTGTTGLDTARELRQATERLHLIIMTSTDLGNVHIAAAAINEDFEFIDKSDVLTARKMRACLDIVIAGMHLALPEGLRRALLGELAAKLESERTPRVDHNYHQLSLTPMDRKIAHLYQSMPTASVAEMAEALGLEGKQGMAAFKQAALRLRDKLRELGYLIPEDQSGRAAVVATLQMLGELD